MATNPTLLIVPIAKNGTKNTIPENQATPGNGLMSQSTGFPAECSLPLGAGGVAPDRADFNGAFNLLGGVAYMAQKGFTFNYDAGQDYYAGCVVIDPNDGARYMCIADMAAGTVAPSADTTNTYWVGFPFGLLNKRDVVTTSGTYTVPVAGWYRIIAKGGGGGGTGGGYSATYARGGGGGGEGATTIAYCIMSAGDSASVVIGAGGSGGAPSNTTTVNAGGDGGNTSVTINGSTYTAGGGAGGAGGGGQGSSSGTYAGASGSNVSPPVAGRAYGNCGGGTGGGVGGSYVDAGVNATSGGGGGGGGASSSDSAATSGGSGGNGFVVFEYFDPSL